MPGPLLGESLIKISCCGVCHTELDEIEGRTFPSHFPVIPGHQIVGTIALTGPSTTRFKKGDRMALHGSFRLAASATIAKTDLKTYVLNLKQPEETPMADAEYMTVNEKFMYFIPEIFSDAEAAPLLCAGAIGHRSLKLSGIKNGETLGLTGFGASGHLVLQTAKHLFPDTSFFVFARNREEREFALSSWGVLGGRYFRRSSTYGTCNYRHNTCMENRNRIVTSSQARWQTGN